MNRSNIISAKDKKFNVKATLNKLGAALIFPLSLLAFASMFMGIAYSLPSDLLIVNFVKVLVGSMFTLFPFLVFISLLNTYIEVKTETTLLEGIIFIMTIVGVNEATTIFFDLTNTTISLFSIMISSLVFVLLYEYNKYKFMWVLIGAVLSIVFIPTFIIINLFVNFLGKLINSFPLGINAFAYGFTNRMLLPFGLHSVMIPTFAFSPIGGYMEVSNDLGVVVKVIDGDSMIWMNLYSHGQNSFDTNGTLIFNGVQYTYTVLGNSTIGQYQQGFLPVTSFMFPMIALSYCWKYGFDKGKTILTGALLTMFSGITETTEYCFILINPLFYLLNSLMVGLSFMLCSVLNVHNWISTGWCIDIILFGLVPTFKGFQTNWYLIPIIGILLGALYSFLFILIHERINNKEKYKYTNSYIQVV